VSAWSEQHAEELAGEALEAVGITDAGVSLIRFRDAFATLRVERPALLIKLGAPEAKDALGRSLRLGQVLREAGVPVAAPAIEVADGPVPAGERWAGIWRWEESRPEMPDPEVIGRSLRRLHETLAEFDEPIPELDPIITSTQRLELIRESGVIPSSSVDFLTARLDRLSDAWDRFETQLRVGPIHGDFKLANLMSTPYGPMIMDLDDVRVAPWEWDLATISRSAHDGWGAEEWPAFASAYGHDLVAQPEAAPLRELTHLGALIFQLARHQSPQRLRRGRALLDEWLQHPERGCHELDWEGVFRRFPDPPAGAQADG
jgi:Ser/Thr protein kinase RdoA (MazF antagonist)